MPRFCGGSRTAWFAKRGKMEFLDTFMTEPTLDTTPLQGWLQRMQASDPAARDALMRVGGLPKVCPLLLSSPFNVVRGSLVWPTRLCKNW
jgi:hypothetical protein